jgi:hypothetical protein
MMDRAVAQWVKGHTMAVALQTGRAGDVPSLTSSCAPFVDRGDSERLYVSL